MTPLCEIALKYGTDKCGYHNYTPVYYDLLKDKKVKRVLEVGIAAGCSLRMWRDFFPGADIFGFDIDPDTFITEERIKCFPCDQNRASSLQTAAMNAGGNFDLIIEDGSHVPIHQIVSAWTLLTFLAPGGIYVIEDVGAYDKNARNPYHIIDLLPSGYDYSVPVLSSGTVDDIEKLIVIQRSYLF
jgi:trans-aconitate methyltransferase